LQSEFGEVYICGVNGGSFNLHHERGIKMRIKEVTSQHRRDFQAIYECEHCGELRKSGGYDDANFHENVIPEMKCTECDKKADGSYVPRETKFPEGYQI